MTADETVEKSVRRWVDLIVVGMNLCPFAARELETNRVRFAVSSATTEEQLLADLDAELALLNSEPAIETTLLIHPRVLQGFADYNQFLDIVDLLLRQSGNEGVLQVASFHPDYQFDGTDMDDAGNYTNRSPYPMLHILREESLERAIGGHPDIDAVPDRNVERMNTLGSERLKVMLEDCLRGGDAGCRRSGS